MTTPNGRQPTAAPEWTLFADWCTGTEQPALPATPAAVAAFLAGNPAAGSTQSRRAAAITAAHVEANLPTPCHSPEVRAAVRAARGLPPAPPPSQPTWERIDPLLQRLPSHGWTQGLFGRRDRLFLTLIDAAGMSSGQIRQLRFSDVTLTATGAVTLTTTGSETLLEPRDDPRLCPGCTWSRWHRVMRLAARPSWRPLAAAMSRTTEVTSRSAHLCQRELGDPIPGGLPVLLTSSRWGHTVLEPPSRRALTGLLAAYRDGRIPTRTPLPDPYAETTTPAELEPEPAPAAPLDWQTTIQDGLAKRHAAVEVLSTATGQMDQFDHDFDELTARITALLEYADHSTH